MKRSLKPADFARMILPFQSGIHPTWTFKQIRSALTQHQMGMLGQSSLLFDSMLEDDEIPSTLKRRCDATLRSKFSLKPVEKESKFPKKKKASDEDDPAEQPRAPAPAEPPPPQVERTVKRKSDGSREETVKEKPGAPAPPVPGPPGEPEPVEPIEVHNKLKPHQRRAAELFCRMFPYGEALRIISDLVMMGEAFATLDWDTRSAAEGGEADVWVPIVRALPTEFARYDHADRRWKYQAQSAAKKWDPTQPLPAVLAAGLGAGELTITPGDGKWLHFSLGGPGGRGWLWGLVRGLAETWHGKQRTLCNWDRYNTKHGLPIIKAKLPIGADEEEKDEFVVDMTGLVAEGVIGLPQDEEGYGYDAELLEPTTVTWQGFQAALERADRKIQVALLGGNLGAEVTKSGGNMGAAATHSSEVEKLAATEAKVLGEVLREQLLRPFFELNFGSEKCKDLPTPCWETCPDEDARAWTTAWGQFATAVETLGKGGYEVANLGDVAKKFGLMLAKKSPAEMAPPPGAGVPGEKPPAKPGAPTAPAASTAK